MATINYKINEGAKTDPTKIYIRFKGNGFDCEMPTEMLVSKNDWSKTKQKVKTTVNSDATRNNINRNLQSLKNYIVDEYNVAYNAGQTINTDWLKIQISSFNGQATNTTKDTSLFLADYADKFAEESKQRTNLKTGQLLKPRTIHDYLDTINKIRAFEIHIGKKIKFSDVDLKFHSDFIQYLRITKRLGDNTIGAKIDNIKSFIRDAELNNIKVNLDYRSSKFYSPSFKPKDIYFSEDEILKIKKHPFELEGYLDNARDWLVIGLWTGLRISDLLELTKKDLKEDYIDNTNFKTEISVTIPIHPYIKEILQKRKGNFPRKISDQNFNDYVKKVAEEVGFTEIIEGSKMCLLEDAERNPILDSNGKRMHRKKQGKYHKYELVTSHICRRSFASNLYGKIDTLTIMKITGHATEKQFLDYIKITPRQHAEKLSKLWSEIYK